MKWIDQAGFACPSAWTGSYGVTAYFAARAAESGLANDTVAGASIGVIVAAGTAMQWSDEEPYFRNQSLALNFAFRAYFGLESEAFRDSQRFSRK
jgi:predicted acylesterase/phospholipase RssA